VLACASSQLCLKCSYSSTRSMIITNLNIVGIAIIKPKTDAPLVIDRD
jgi:hypothetical protein